MNNVIELNTDKTLTWRELLTKEARRDGDFDDVILVYRKSNGDGTESYTITCSGDQANKELFWSLSAAADVIMHG